MFNFLIPVTQDHIDTGRCGDEYNCALAKAIDASIIGSDSYVVGHFITIWIENYGRKTYDTTNRLASWISKFDDDKTRVNPFTLHLYRTGTRFYADVLEPDLSEEL
jgi:hypothetical protein